MKMKNPLQVKGKAKMNGLKPQAIGKPQKKIDKPANPPPAKNGKTNIQSRNLGATKTKISQKVVQQDDESDEEDESEEEVQNDSGEENSDEEEEVSEEEEDDEADDDDAEEEESGEEESGDEEQSETDLINFEAEEGDEEESSGEDEEDSDDEPAEEPISKIDNFNEPPKKNKKTGSGALKEVKGNKNGQSENLKPKPVKLEYEIETKINPKSIADELAVYVRNLPLSVSLETIVEAFGKYGRITAYCGYRGSGVVAFETPESAIAALQANNKITIKDKVIGVVPKVSNISKLTPEERKKENDAKKMNTVYITHLRYGTTEDQIREHFEKCGTIEDISLKKKNAVLYAFITFSNENEAKKAKGLHNTTLNKNAISVSLRDEDLTRDPKLTIALINKNQLETCSEEKIRAAFEQCGEIKTIRMICKKHILAFVAFENEEAATKARQLSGTTFGDLRIEIESLKIPSSKTTVFVQNVKPGTTEDQIRALFASAGEIESLVVKQNFAIVKFVDSDGFCKSFLLNESFLQGQMIFLEPYSEKKIETLRKNRTTQKRPMKSKSKFTGAKKAKLSN